MSDPRHTVKQMFAEGDGLPRPEYHCGRVGAVAPFNDFHFLDAGHLVRNVGGSIQPCKDCIRAIIRELNKELEG